MEPITARFCWTVDDMIVGRKHTTKAGIFGLPLICMVAAICCGILLKGVPSGKSYSLKTSLVILGIFAVAAIVSAIAIFLTRKIELASTRRKFNKRPDAGDHIEWTFSDQEITTSSENTKSEMKWSAFHKVIVTPDGLVFMPCAEIFHFIPARAFASPEDIEIVTGLARQRIGDFKIVK